MTADVHRLTAAGPITEPQADVVETLRRLLTEAERAEIKGLGYFLVTGNNGVSTGWEPGCADRNDMVAGAALLQGRVISAHLAMREPDEPRDPA